MNKYWFRKRQGLKSKDLGWGWIPITWEGWLAVLLFFALIAILGYILDIFSSEVSVAQGFTFLAGLLVLLILASFISRSKTKP